MNKLLSILLVVVLGACSHHTEIYDSTGQKVNRLDCRIEACDTDLSTMCGERGYQILSAENLPRGGRRVITFKCGNE